MSIAAVVLAAGSSSRFTAEASKLVMPFRDRPLVSWAVESALGAKLDETVVIIGAVDLSEVLPRGVTVLRNSSWRTGIATSLRVAIDWCSRRGHGAAVVGLGDQPLIPASAWRAVADAKGHPITVATYEGHRRNPVKLESSVWSLLPVSGDEGARALMRERPELVGEVACEGDPIDIDTVEDLRPWS